MTTEPGFLGGEDQNRREQFAERIENLAHGALGCAPSRRIGRVAIEPVFCYVDIETAQVDGAELIKRLINLVKFVGGVSRAAIVDHLLEAVENPPVHKRKFHFPFFLLS